ncbi:family 16 glycosylhydrolase [Sphingobacterium oryzagri]|uniref:Family 16 glycosylhydrolase n=1 Tax=Sphingobacterium oryzagri TaxID=3025669 RepID=A0ABY7WD21_9SPHI|nr:family 43 glycosylhydrolase [Sphingobacterium sp. KACC 22765]WDF67552.1 family 16 glycosylhydrolase [Sphingobacterium sp. KACC 22765]
MKRYVAVIAFLFSCFSTIAQQPAPAGYVLVWADEFDQDGTPNANFWNFEEGFKRNREDQWYQKENAHCQDGFLYITARKEVKPNPTYQAGSKDWALSRKKIQYSSASLNTMGKKKWQYGRFEMRAKIPIGSGLWPAFWTLGVDKEWPSNGQIDIMEYYRGDILANIATGTKERWKAAWHTASKKVAELGGEKWADEFHLWRMDWDEKEIALYVDDSLMNKVAVDALVNQDGTGFNPFKQPHYLLLNFALGGINGGAIDDKLLPARYQIDYVRVYQQAADTAAKASEFRPGARWEDQNGEHINAHGGGIIFHEGTYYWYGEKRGGKTSLGVNVYSSKDLYNWRFEKLAFSPSDDPSSAIAWGCIMERPKVIYNAANKKFVMWFHLELKGQGYAAARAAVAVSDTPTGPFTFVDSFRPNGNMSRDMGLFVDDDEQAYHIYSSDENYALRLVRLTPDYLQATTEDKLLFRNHREAPALFKYNNKYYLFTSGCTGWAPNKAELHVADKLFGPWQSLGDPMRGPQSTLTFDGQSTYVLPVQGKKDAFIFMADRWKPNNLLDSRYLWLPISLENGEVTVNWQDQWDLSVFD